MCLCFTVTQCNVEEKIPKYYVNLQKIRLAATPESELCMQIFSPK